ncbi:MAG: AAA family ATPase [Spirochaetota bacterium]
MKVLNTWFTYWQNDLDWFYAKTFGNQQIFYGSSLLSVRSAIKQAAQKKSLQILAIDGNPKKVSASVSLFASHDDWKHKYSLPFSFPIHIEAVLYRQKKIPYYTCEIAYLDIHFYLEDPKKLTELIQYHVTNYLSQLPIEELVLMVSNKTSKLGKVSIRNKQLVRSPKSQTFTVPMEWLHVLEPVLLESKKQKTNTLMPQTAWARDKLISEIGDKIRSNNVILIGGHGVGKTILFQTAVSQLPAKEKERPYLQTEAKKIISRAKYFGEWQEECDYLLEYLKSIQGILYVSDVMELLFTGGMNIVDSLAAYILPFLKSGELQLLGEMTQEEYEKASYLLPAFMDLFETIHIPEMTEKEVFRVLVAYQQELKNNHRIQFAKEAIETSYHLSKKYIHNESFPGKILRFLSSCAGKKIREIDKNIQLADIYAGFQMLTGLPEILFNDHILLKKSDLQEYFAGKIIGQESAVEEVSSVVHVFKTGMNDPRKPIASILFSGPTGVGKTALAKALSDYFFGNGQIRNPLFRLDMSEFQDPFQITRLIGNDPRVPSPLIQHVRSNHFSVILLDEIEKADVSFFDVLMTILDEGIFTDSLGREVNFKSSIIIMTSNLGSEKQTIAGFGKQTIDYAAPIHKFFRPEFVNRIDKITLFNNLDQSSIGKITNLELQQVAGREGLQKRDILLEFSQGLQEWLAKNAYHPSYGARPLKRFIERTIITAIGKYLLQFPKLRNAILSIDRAEEEITISTKQL